MGKPKALIRSESGESWPARAARLLHEGGCESVVVVLGAEADQARMLLPAVPWLDSVTAADHAVGLSRSLICGLGTLDATADAAVLMLADLPSAVPDEVARVLGGDGRRLPPADPATLRQATHAGAPGHPVVVGREHWTAVAAEVHGDRGAGPYLKRHGVVFVDCSDLSDGADVDRDPLLHP